MYASMLFTSNFSCLLYMKVQHLSALKNNYKCPFYELCMSIVSFKMLPIPWNKCRTKANVVITTTSDLFEKQNYKLLTFLRQSLVTMPPGVSPLKIPRSRVNSMSICNQLVLTSSGGQQQFLPRSYDSKLLAMGLQPQCLQGNSPSCHLFWFSECCCYYASLLVHLQLK